MIFGQPASGKSFLAVDLAASIATGRAFQGLKTQKGDVVYIAASSAALLLGPHITILALKKLEL